MNRRRLAPIGIGVGIGVAGIAALHTAPSLVALSSIGRHLAPSLAGVGDRGHVALTFDDGPDQSSTPAVLEALDALGWHATFFMLGEMVRKAPGLAAEVAAAGHEIGVHGDRHRTLLRLGPRTTHDDIERAAEAIVTATGVLPTWYRPPFGTLSVGGLIAARRLGLQVVLWTAWGRDWRAEATGSSVADDVLDGFVEGGTVLLHDSDCTSAPESWRSTLDALPLLAKGFADRGLVVGPVGEHGIAATPVAATPTPMVVLFALSAGLFYALASVLQHRVAAEQAPELSLRPGLLLALVKRPLWLAGIVLDLGAYLMEAAALAVGSIVVVQPLLVSGLLFALPLSAIGGVGKPRRREWSAAIALTLGIAVFVTVGSPSGGSSQAPIWQWSIVFAVCASIALGAIVLSRGAAPHVRALSLAFATGATYAVTAALTKTVVDVLGDHGISGMVGAWETYALAVVSVAGLLLNQSAFQAGHLAASLPALAVTNPVLSSIIGVTLFGETLGATGPIPVALTVFSVVVMIAGTISLSRSPLVTGENAHPAITPAAP